MHNKKDQYEAIIGLEIHAQLLTKTKAYSGDENIYGASPNTKTSVISLGHPGTLPKSNKKVIEFATMIGIAVGSKITKVNMFARKNYFYADLPKGYQITQDKTPICLGGKILISNKKNEKKYINLTRIHIEEDAGKSIHDLDPFNSLVDLNRAGVPLIEIVTEPEIKNSDEAYLFITEVRKILRYLEICDGNMEEGSLRCDANISIMKKGAKKFGTKVEVKNMNSIRNVKRAIDYEINRQIEIVEKNQKIKQETRSFNATSGETISMRSKEESNDYRYFPEPDLLPVEITDSYVSKIKKSLPLLPNQLFDKFVNQYNLSDYDALIIIDDKEIALFFDELCNYTNNYKSAANYINGCIKSYLKENGISINELGISYKQISDLIKLVDDGEVSNSVATQKIFPLLINSKKSPKEIAKSNNLTKENDEKIILDYIKESLQKYPEKVSQYKSGKKGLIGLFMGEVMKLSKGKADPKLSNKLLKEILDEKCTE